MTASFDGLVTGRRIGSKRRLHTSDGRRQTPKSTGSREVG
ncbi:hypothetical protein SAMN04488124_3317 [Halogeometricum limi]|uniref:Uncharacterized protein n=1 Tax=Halogeometricum limi TaxID=555875 RepID=A0A1I6IK39_9EURY|nr:hypothetical protein SAMN04488124_3317 [Halogeometricum limi]